MWKQHQMEDWKIKHEWGIPFVESSDIGSGVVNFCTNCDLRIFYDLKKEAWIPAKAGSTLFICDDIPASCEAVKMVQALE